VISHWDDVRTWRGERGHIAGTWSSLTGCSSRSEIFVVLEGDGHLLLYEEGGVEEHAMRAGAVVVRPRRPVSHTPSVAVHKA
jgi:hypothetical protein